MTLAPVFPQSSQGMPALAATLIIGGPPSHLNHSIGPRRCAPASVPGWDENSVSVPICKVCTMQSGGILILTKLSLHLSLLWICRLISLNQSHPFLLLRSESRRPQTGTFVRGEIHPRLGSLPSLRQPNNAFTQYLSLLRSSSARTSFRDPITQGFTCAACSKPPSFHDKHPSI